jgi:hypothetical protein
MFLPAHGSQRYPSNSLDPNKLVYFFDHILLFKQILNHLSILNFLLNLNIVAIIMHTHKDVGLRLHEKGHSRSAEPINRQLIVSYK